MPFLNVVARRGIVGSDLVEKLADLRPDQRIYVEYVHSLLQCIEQRDDDWVLGLQASEAMTTGDAGVFDFLMTSADTPRAAVEAASRYARLLSDALDISLHVRGERAIARLESRISIPRAGEDFALASMMRNQVFSWPEGMLEDMDVWFRHDEPRNLAPYREALGKVRLHFQAEFSGWSFAARYLDVPLRKRDARLHSVLRDAADNVLAALPSTGSLIERSMQLIADGLASGESALEEIARKLHVHPRKLSRELKREGTTFEELLDTQRRNIALRHLANSELPIGTVAKMTGFKGRAQFHRAFRRWTQLTPLAYRRKHRR